MTLYVRFHANQTRFHLKAFASFVVLKQYRKWPIKKLSPPKIAQPGPFKTLGRLLSYKHLI